MSISLLPLLDPRHEGHVVLNHDIVTEAMMRGTAPPGFGGLWVRASELLEGNNLPNKMLSLLDLYNTMETCSWFEYFRILFLRKIKKQYARLSKIAALVDLVGPKTESMLVVEKDHN
jgi:hypothetical protein